MCLLTQEKTLHCVILRKAERQMTENQQLTLTLLNVHSKTGYVILHGWLYDIFFSKQI